MDDRPIMKPGVAMLAAIFMASLVTLFGAFAAVSHLGGVAGGVASRGYADIWTALHLFALICIVAGLAGAWLSIRRRRPLLALPFLVLPFVGEVVMEANRCDYLPACAATDWLRLPHGAAGWSFPDQGAKTRRASPPPRVTVLDGDTLVFNGKLVRLAGVDAPELGQTARCWAEAALGGESRQALEELFAPSMEPDASPDWRLAEVSAPDAQGRVRANIVSSDGGDVRDSMVVHGFAARTEGRWNWCGPGGRYATRAVDQPPPYGPNLLRPADDLYDARAED